MQLVQRSYQCDDDFWRIRAFLRDALLRNDYREKCWHVVRFDYWRWHGVENIEHMRLEDVICLWETTNGRLAAMLNPEGKGEAFLHLHPDYQTPELQAEMVAVAEQRLAAVDAEGSHTLRIWIEEHDRTGQELMRQRGYAPHDGPEYMRWRLMDAPMPEPTLKAGYTVRPLGDGAELLERCYASGLAFHENDIRIAVANRNDVTWYRNIQTAPLYRRDLDIVAIAPDGAVASFCTVWFDDVTRTGVFEPVATVPAYQRKGLGKAVMAEGLRRLQRMGALRAYVGSYSPEAGALYAASGFTAYDLLQAWNGSCKVD